MTMDKQQAAREAFNNAARLQLCKTRYAHKRIFILDTEGLWQRHQ